MKDLKNSGEDVSDYIIKHIKRYYSSDKLYENRNEMKENMTELIHKPIENKFKDENGKWRVTYDLGNELSKLLNPKVGDTATIIDSENREWNYVAKYWSKPGFYPGMIWEGQKGNPWMNSFGAREGTIRSQFYKGVKSVTLNGLTENMSTSINPGDRVKMDYYAKSNNGATGTCKGRIGQLCSIEWDDGSKSKEITTYLTKIDNVNESNELEQRAKKHKKKSKGMGWHMAVNAGDVEKGIEVFNNSTSLGTSSGEGTAMGEAIESNTYYYNGPIYYRGHKIAEKSDIYTTAKSLNVAIRNVLYKASQGDRDNLYQYDIVDQLVKEIPKEETPQIRPKCQMCGYEINDIGDCPVCDYGEDDLLESLSDLEALWTLKNLD